MVAHGCAMQDISNREVHFLALFGGRILFSHTLLATLEYELTGQSYKISGVISVRLTTHPRSGVAMS